MNKGEPKFKISAQHIITRYVKEDIEQKNLLADLRWLVRERCKEQREICASEIVEESKDDQLIYEQTEAIRNLVKNAPEPKI